MTHEQHFIPTTSHQLIIFSQQSKPSIPALDQRRECAELRFGLDKQNKCSCSDKATLRTKNIEPPTLANTRGFSLIEVLIAALILEISLLGLIGIARHALRQTIQGYEHSQTISNSTNNRACVRTGDPNCLATLSNTTAPLTISR